jgi:hypothetical protein
MSGWAMRMVFLRCVGRVFAVIAAELAMGQGEQVYLMRRKERMRKH